MIYIKASDDNIRNDVNNHFVPFMSNYADFYGKDESKTLYESYRPDPKLKSALKKTSSFGPQSEKPKQLTAEQLTPQRLIPKRPEKTVMFFSDNRFSHFSSYPNDLKPSINRDWIVGRTKSF